ncbi:YhbY family RNA-binding protein, partial [Candidatus Woesearchaeota archaeon]
RARTLQPIMSVGKNGITQGTVQLLDRELEQKQLVKVKLLRAFTQDHNRKEAAAELARFTKSRVVLAVGNTIVFYRPRRQ